MQNEPAYLTAYTAFLDKFRLAEMSGEEVGLLIAQMASHYSRWNIELGRALKVYAAVNRDQHNAILPDGKAISSAKAVVLAEASLEASVYEEAKVHVQNLEQIINALKSLQKGVLLEYSHAS